MSVFAGAGGKAGANKKVQQNPELGPKFAAVKVFNLFPVKSHEIIFCHRDWRQI